jgi:hypothetical protein
MIFCNRVVVTKVLLLVQVMILRSMLKNRTRGEGGMCFIEDETNWSVERIVMML